MDLEDRVGGVVLSRRQVLGLGLGLAAAVGGSVLHSGLWVPQAYAKEAEPDAKQPDLYQLLFSRNISERDHAISGMFDEVYSILHEVYDTRKEPKTPFKLTDAVKKELDKARAQVNQKIDALEAVASQRELGIEKAFFDKQRDFVKGIDPTQYDWSLAFHPALWKEEFVTAVDRSIAKILERTEIKHMQDLGYVIPTNMSLVVAGTFWRGSTEKTSIFFENRTTLAIPSQWKMGGNYFASQSYRAESPRTPQEMRYSFWVDTTEFTNEQFRVYLIKTGRRNTSGAKFGDVHPGNPVPYTWFDEVTYREGQGNLPCVLGISLHEGKKIAEFLKKEIPTQDESEKAAGGFSGPLWPWGNRLKTSYGAFWETMKERNGFLAPVGSFPEGVSPFGVFDMAGNAPEWTLPVSRETYTTSGNQTTDRIFPSKYAGVIKSASWGGDLSLAEDRCARGAWWNAGQSVKVGIRFVQHIPAQYQYILQPGQQNVTQPGDKPAMK